MAYNENPIYAGSFFALLRSLVFNLLRRLKIKARVFFSSKLSGIPSSSLTEIDTKQKDSPKDKEFWSGYFTPSFIRVTPYGDVTKNDQMLLKRCCPSDCYSWSILVSNSELMSYQKCGVVVSGVQKQHDI